MSKKAKPVQKHCFVEAKLKTEEREGLGFAKAKEEHPTSTTIGFAKAIEDKAN